MHLLRVALRVEQAPAHARRQAWLGEGRAKLDGHLEHLAVEAEAVVLDEAAEVIGPTGHDGLERAGMVRCDLQEDLAAQLVDREARRHPYLEIAAGVDDP